MGDDQFERGYLQQDWGSKYQEQKLDRTLFPKEQPLPRKDRPPIVPVLPIKQMLPEPTNEAEIHAAGLGEYERRHPSYQWAGSTSPCNTRQ